MPLAPRTLLAVAVAVVWTAPLQAAGPKTEEIVARAVAYVADFVEHFTSIVAEERFVQDGRTIGNQKGAAAKGSVNGTAMVGAGVSIHRELVSDYLLVKSPGLTPWQVFRDVVEVDGRPVRDRGERLAEIGRSVV